MLSEKEKMIAGELYNAADPELRQAALEARQHLQRLNASLTATLRGSPSHSIGFVWQDWPTMPSDTPFFL
jgi:hypothetical protein